MNNLFQTLLITMVGIVATAQRSHATVLEFTVKPLWEAAAGDFTTIDFTGFAGSTFITDQYAGEGLLFTDGNDVIANQGLKIFPNDGSGLAGSLNSVNSDINVEFSFPVFSIGADFPGSLQILLFSQGELIYTSSKFGSSGAGFFAGLVSTEPFDMARLLDASDPTVAIDDLHFGVPAPGAIPLIAFAALWPRHRRRR